MLMGEDLESETKVEAVEVRVPDLPSVPTSDVNVVQSTAALPDLPEPPSRAEVSSAVVGEEREERQLVAAI